MRLAWSTDLHLNFASLIAWEQWLEQFDRCNADGLIISGDISESTDLLFQLDRVHLAIGKPLYFVLGNHDFYHGSIRSVRSLVRNHCKRFDGLHYLSGASGIELDSDWTLMGHDGWGDATLGDYEASPVELADFEMIKDLEGLSKGVLYERLRELGRDAAETLKPTLIETLSKGKNAIVVTHVPPFAESCWYEGRHSDPDWLPFFSCGAMGEMLRATAKQYPQRTIRVLCGHTHHAGRATLLDNLQVITASAEYGWPTIFDCSAWPVL